MKQTDSKTLADALRVLASDIQSDDGVANACIAEAADRIDQLCAEVERAAKASEYWHKQYVRRCADMNDRIARLGSEIEALESTVEQQAARITDQAAALAKAREALVANLVGTSGRTKKTHEALAAIDALSPHDDCSECKAFAPTTDSACRKCKAATLAFSDAVAEFMKGGSK